MFSALDKAICRLGRGNYTAQPEGLKNDQAALTSVGWEPRHHGTGREGRHERESSRLVEIELKY